MADILAKNPKLDDVIRRAANRLGENHGLTRDSHGAVIDNQGNSTRYVGSHGQHPSQLDKPQSSKAFGWHRTLNENEIHETLLLEKKKKRRNLLKWCCDNLKGGLGVGQWCCRGAVIGASIQGPDGGTMTPEDWTQMERKIEGMMNSGEYGDSGADPRPIEPKGDKQFDVQVEEGDCLGEDCGGTHEMEEDIKWPSMKKIRKWKNKVKSLAGVNEDSELKEAAEPCVQNVECARGYTWDDGECRCMGRDEIDEVTGASSSGSFESPLFGTMDESERILKSVIREEISKKVNKKSLKESLKNRITKNILNEKDYFSGKLKYEKPTKLPGEIKSMPGMKQTDSTLKKSKSENTKYLKHFDKKIKDYLDFEGNSHPEFPHQNNSKTDYKSPMYRNTGEDQDFIDDFRGMGLEDANGVDMLDRIDDYLSGSQETGNAQTGKDGKALGNVVPSKTGERIKKKVKRKKEKIAKRKSKMTNLKGITPDVQTTSLKESLLFEDMQSNPTSPKECWKKEKDDCLRCPERECNKKTTPCVYRTLQACEDDINGFTGPLYSEGNQGIEESYLLTERKWWQIGLRILGCCTVLFPFLFRCCIDTFRSARIAHPPSDFPPFDPGLSREEIKSLKPHENARSWEDLPENIRAILSKAQPKILAYIEEVKAMGGDNPRGKKVEPVTMNSPMPLGPGEIKPRTTASGTVTEEVNKMKHLFNYKETTQ